MKHNSILGGALILTAGNLFLRLCSMVFQVYLSRSVGAAGMGLLQLILTVNALAMVLGCSGVRVAAMILSAEEYGLRRQEGVRRAVHVCLLYGLCVSSVVGMLMFRFSHFLAVQWVGNPEAASSLGLTGLFLPCACLCSIMGGYFTACGKLHQYVAVEIGERLISLLITLVLLQTWAGHDLERSCLAIVGGSSVGSFLDFLILYALFRRNCPPCPTSSRPPMARRLIRLCIPLALNDYLRCGLNTVEQFLIPFGLQQYGKSYETAMSEYGTLHGMVFPAFMFPAVLLYSLSDLLVPALSRAKACRNPVRIRFLTRRCLYIGLLFASAVSGFFLVGARPLGLLLYHSETAAQELFVYAPVILILYTDAIVDGVLKGLSQQLSSVRYNTLTSFLDVAGLFFLLPRWGMTGYFISFVLTHLLNLFLSLRRLCKVTFWKPALKQVLRVLTATGASVLFTIWLIPDTIGTIPLLVLRSGSFVCLLCILVLPLCRFSTAAVEKNG